MYLINLNGFRKGYIFVVVCRMYNTIKRITILAVKLWHSPRPKMSKFFICWEAEETWGFLKSLVCEKWFLFWQTVTWLRVFKQFVVYVLAIHSIVSLMVWTKIYGSKHYLQKTEDKRKNNIMHSKSGLETALCWKLSGMCESTRIWTIATQRTPYTQTHGHKHTHTHKYAHTYLHTHTRKHTCTHTHTHTHTPIQNAESDLLGIWQSKTTNYGYRVKQHYETSLCGPSPTIDSSPLLLFSPALIPSCCFLLHLSLPAAPSTGSHRHSWL